MPAIILGLVGAVGVGVAGAAHASHCPKLGRVWAIFWAICSGVMLADWAAQLIALVIS